MWMEAPKLLNSRRLPDSHSPVVQALQTARMKIWSEAMELETGQRYGALLELAGLILEAEGRYERLRAA